MINIYKFCYINLISIQALPLTMKLVTIMEVKKIIYYQDEDMFIGWLEEFPDYKTQGETIDELKENLKDIYDDLTSGKISNVLHIGELRVA